jgi:purine-binding chemotaxis protein CheW
MTLAGTDLVALDDQAAVDAVLGARARSLATVVPVEDRARAIEVLVCRLGSEEFAVELRLLNGVFRADGLTKVPCAPPFVAGVLNLRGEIVTVLDLAVVVGLIASDRREVLLAETPHVRVGLLVDEALGVRWIGLDALEAAPNGTDFVRGIADARTTVVDLEVLLTDRRFELPA